MHPPRRLFFQFTVLVGWGATVLQAEPTPPENVVFNPTFLEARESFSAGTAFAAKRADGEPAVLVTCHHLFGPAGDLETQMTAEDIEKSIVGVAVVSISDPKVVLVTSRYIKVEGARTFDDQGCNKDLALFEFPSAPHALRIAAKPAMPGDRVWLYARLRGIRPLALYAATVVYSTPLGINYVFEEADLQLYGTSGAPVLSESGEVVAVNLGGGLRKDRLTGIGNPAAALLAAWPAKN